MVLTTGLAGGRRPFGAASGVTRSMQSQQSCTPGHTDGDPPCTQIRDDRRAPTRFGGGDSAQLVSFEYPCGWVVGTRREGEYVQTNVTRSEIGESNAYVDVQVRTHDGPVEAGFLDEQRSEGNYEDLEYEYDGTTRTGIVSAIETAQFGTTAHAVVPSHWGEGERHVEFVSTLKGADCSRPRPDYQLVRDMLASLEPNRPVATVTFADQRVSGEVETQAVTVERVSLPGGGYVGIVADGAADVDLDALVGASTYRTAGSHENVRVALDERVETETRLTAVPFRDTDGDNVFEFVGSGDLDGPYRGLDGAPVTDEASVAVGVPTPTTATATRTRTPTPTPTRESAGTATSGATATPATTDTATDTATATGTRTDGAGPGFGVLGTLCGVGLTGLALARRHLRGSSE